MFTNRLTGYFAAMDRVNERRIMVAAPPRPPERITVAWGVAQPTWPADGMLTVAEFLAGFGLDKDAARGQGAGLMQWATGKKLNGRCTTGGQGGSRWPLEMLCLYFKDRRVRDVFLVVDDLLALV
jgi:hypothetical protein